MIVINFLAPTPIPLPGKTLKIERRSAISRSEPASHAGPSSHHAGGCLCRRSLHCWRSLYRLRNATSRSPELARIQSPTRPDQRHCPNSSNPPGRPLYGSVFLHLARPAVAGRSVAHPTYDGSDLRLERPGRRACPRGEGFTATVGWNSCHHSGCYSSDPERRESLSETVD